jgi:hypothetical protein
VGADLSAIVYLLKIKRNANDFAPTITIPPTDNPISYRCSSLLVALYGLCRKHRDQDHMLYAKGVFPTQTGFTC